MLADLQVAYETLQKMHPEVAFSAEFLLFFPRSCAPESQVYVGGCGVLSRQLSTKLLSRYISRDICCLLRGNLSDKIYDNNLRMLTTETLNDNKTTS
jgi:hypothetical protein